MIRQLDWRAFGAMTRLELLLATRRLENLFVTLALPAVVLVFLAIGPVLPADGPEGRVGIAVAVVLTVALMATGLVSLAIATAYERGYGVLKRLRGSPLPVTALLGAKAVAVLVTFAVQIVLVGLLAMVLGWSPRDGPVTAIATAAPWLMLGALCFCALGLLLAGLLRPEAVLAAANGLFVVAVLLGGVVIPVDQLPGPLGLAVSILPPALVAELLRDTLGGSTANGLHAAMLSAWTTGLITAAATTFRTEP